MSEDAAINSLRTLCRDAEKEVLKTRKAIEKLKVKQLEAEKRLETLQQALDHVTKAATDSKPRSFQDEVDAIISAAGESGLTAREVYSKLLEKGIVEESVQNVGAMIHVAATRLSDKGVIEILDGSAGKIFRSRLASKSQQEVEA